MIREPKKTFGESFFVPVCNTETAPLLTAFLPRRAANVGGSAYFDPADKKDRLKSAVRQPVFTGVPVNYFSISDKDIA